MSDNKTKEHLKKLKKTLALCGLGIFCATQTAKADPGKINPAPEKDKKQPKTEKISTLKDNDEKTIDYITHEPILVQTEKTVAMLFDDEFLRKDRNDAKIAKDNNDGDNKSQDNNERNHNSDISQNMYGLPGRGFHGRRD